MSEQPTVTDGRRAMRADPRDEARQRAAKRTAELREHGLADESTEDKYFIAPSEIPDGWSYEWKRKTCYGAEDPAYDVQLARQGWEPVDVSRHPEFMPKGYKGAIERDGMILMERPTEIVEEAKKRDARKARLQVQAKEAEMAGAPSGHFERSNKDESMVKVKKSMEHVAIPD